MRRNNRTSVVGTALSHSCGFMSGPLFALHLLTLSLGDSGALLGASALMSVTSMSRTFDNSFLSSGFSITSVFSASNLPRFPHKFCWWYFFLVFPLCYWCNLSSYSFCFINGTLWRKVIKYLYLVWILNDESLRIFTAGLIVPLNKLPSQPQRTQLLFGSNINFPQRDCWKDKKWDLKGLGEW